MITLLVEALRGRGGYNCLHISAADLERNDGKVLVDSSPPAALSRVEYY